MVEQQTETVDKVLEELDLGNIHVLTVWNKVQKNAIKIKITKSYQIIPSSIHICFPFFLSIFSFSCFLQIDRAANPKALRKLAQRRGKTVCISALTGEGMEDFYLAVEEALKVGH